MAQTYRDANENLHVLRGGIWRAATNEESELLEQNVVESSGRAFGEAFKGTLGLLSAAAGVVGRGGFRGGGQLGGDDGFAQQLIDTGLGRAGESAAALDEREVLSPGGAFAGQFAELFVDPLALVGAGAGGAAAKSGASQFARRSMRGGNVGIRHDSAQREIMQLAGVADGPAVQSAANVTPEAMRTIGAVVDTFGAGSAGAAERTGLWEGLKRMPVLRSMLEGLEDFAGTARPISADQRALIPRMEQLGFEFFRGQREGNNLIGELVKSQPFMADAFDPILTANGRNLERRALRAVGLEGDEFSRNGLRQAEDELGARFGRVAESIRPAALPDELRAALDDPDILTPRDIRLFGIADEAASEPVAGRDLMELRSRINDAFAAANSDRALGVRSRRILESLDALDDLIIKQIDDPAMVDLWRDTQQRWRVVLALNSRGVVTESGELSLKRFNTSLERSFERQYRKQLFAPQDGSLPPDIVELMDYVRGARAFESNLGDSGTATRLALQHMVQHPVQFTQQRLAASFVSDVLLDIPKAVP